MNSKRDRLSQVFKRLWNQVSLDKEQELEEKESSTEERGRIQMEGLHLSEEKLESLQKMAAIRKTSPNEVLQEIVEWYLRSEADRSTSPRMREGRMEKNPLLRLQGLASNPTEF